MCSNMKPYSAQHRKQLFNIKQGRKDGLLLQIHCTKLQHPNDPGKLDVRFTNVAFNDTGQTLIAATSKGDIYNFDFTQSRFWHLTNTSSCIFLKFNLLNSQEIFVGKNNGVINIIDVESGELVDTLEAHKDPVKDVSFARECLCVSSSTSEAIVWDLRSRTKLLNLCISTKTVLKQVLFIPISDNVLTCFNDDSIHIWKYGSFDHMKEIQPALWNKFKIKCLAFSRNGRVLVLGGYSQHLAVFLIDTWHLEKTIVLPAPINAVKTLDFISQPFDGGSNQVLSILATNGTVYFYNMQQDTILSKLTFAVEVTRYDSSYDGRYIACITSDGEANVYSLAPYVAIRDDGKKRVVKVDGRSRKIFNVLKKPTSAVYIAKEKIDNVLEIGKLLSILKQYGRYPEMHRFKIWKQLLQLPYNIQQYQILSSKYAQVPFQDLERRYPIDNRVLLKNLKKLLFGLCLWCPFFGEVAYLPLLAFPFVKIFQYDPLICFEAVVTILINWCQYWFEYYPLPPVNILAMIENVFLHHDPTLLQHLTLNEVTSKIYAWSLMQTCFSEILSSQDWLILWDHILSNEPSFIVMVTVAYSLHQKQYLTALSELNDFKDFYHKQNLIDIKRLLSKAYQLLESTEDIFHPRRYLENFRKLEEGMYPVFVDYPKAVVDYQKSAQVLRSAKKASDKQENHFLKRTVIEYEKIDEVKQKIEEQIRLKEVDRIYKKKLEEDQENVTKQTLRLNHHQQMLENETNSSCTYISSQETSRLHLEAYSEKHSHLVNKYLFQHKQLYYYQIFLETDYAVEAYIAKEYLDMPSPQNYRHEIEKKITDVIAKTETIANSEQYLSQLAVATGLTVLEKAITLLKEKIKECSSEDKTINQSFLIFMIGQIDKTERHVEAALKDFPTNDNVMGNIRLNSLRREYTQFRNTACGGSDASMGTI